MIRSFGESSFPVAYAGQTSWQRPHSVQDIVSRIPFHVRSETVPAPKRSSSSGRVEVERLEAAAAARVRPKKTFGPAVAMCRCFEYGR